MLITGIIINILLIKMLLIGLFHKFKQPKHKAVFGYTIAANMALYIFWLSIIAICGFVTNHNLYSLILFLCAISPFIIGKLVNYNSLKLYTVIQILICLFSLAILLIYL